MSPSAVSAQAILADVIPSLGCQPEGIANGPGTTMLSTSIATADILAEDVFTGESQLVVDAPPGAHRRLLLSVNGGGRW